MRVYLCRHAEAAPGEPDELRALTEQGREQSLRLAERLAASTPIPVLVVTSPLLRARQTAAVIAARLSIEVMVDTRLAPGATADSLQELVGGLGSPLAAVGHQPDCSEIVNALTGHDPEFPVAGMAILELGELPR